MWDTLVPPGPERAAEFYAAGWWRRETFLDDLARAAAERPQHPAVIGYEDGKHARTLTYAELAAMVTRFAGALAELGVANGDVVVLYLPNRWILAPLYLACMRIGAVAAPALPVLGRRELGHVLRVSRARVCVTLGGEYAERLAQAAPETLRHRVIVDGQQDHGAIDFGEFFVWRQPEEDGQRLPGPSGPDDPALLVFTSGTTGQPKAVVHTQNTMYAAGRSLSVPFRLTGADIVSIPQFLTHVAGAIHAVLAPITLGATCAMQDTNTDMELLLGMTAEHGITYIHAAPAYLAGQRGQPRDTASLRLISSSSAPIPPSMVTGIRDVFGLPLYACWGMTETGGCTTTRPSDPADWAIHSDGRTMPWMQTRVAAEPGSAIGRLLVRGASQCIGYLCQREAYLACLGPDDWFDTGDMARDDGRGGIRITGRRADLITRASGAKIPTLEVEMLLTRHPAVAEAVLIGYPDPDVPGADLVCAMVVPRGERPTLAQLRGYLDAEGMSHRLWPDRLECRPDLPKNSLGKVLRERLREQLAS